MERKLTFCGVTYYDIGHELSITRNKFEVTNLKITDSQIGIVQAIMFVGFENIINLELSQCNIDKLDNNVFDTLIRLNSINLSNNAIATIHESLFALNQNLKTVILKNNVLDIISSGVFAIAASLEVLDLSYNNILVLDEQLYNCVNLQHLYLNNNRIRFIFSFAFNTLTSLISLVLTSNKIAKLEETVFANLIQLRHLDLNDNLIVEIHYKCFWNLHHLGVLYLGRNMLTEQCNEAELFVYNFNLIDLDLSDNDYFPISRYTFESCTDLKFLKLSVSRTFSILAVRDLKCLTQLELVSKQLYFRWTYPFRAIIESLITITLLKLVFQKLDEIRICNFSRLINLESLHIECLEPNDRSHEFDSTKTFPYSPQLKYLTMKKVNHFIIYKHDCEIRNLKHLNLEGIKNRQFPFCFLNNILLEYLNLSFSDIEEIPDYSFEQMENLKHLDLQFSKLKEIRSTTFKNNYKLEFLNCSHCCITRIDDGSFSNLRNLKELHLSQNPLKVISKNVLDGLNKEARIIIS